MLADQKLANTKRLEDEKKASEEQLRLSAIEANKILEENVAKDTLIAAQKAQALAKTGEEIAAAQMLAAEAQKQIDQLELEQ